MRISATDPLSISSLNNASDEFTLKFTYPCAYDEVTQSNSQNKEHVQVFIDEATSTDITILFTESDTGCVSYLTYRLWFYDED